MITFLLYTVVAWIATASLAKILHLSIQPGQWLDKLLKWQQRLHAWDLQGKEFLVKVGGYCELCFSHFITFVSFWVYLLFMTIVLGNWITAGIDAPLLSFVFNVIWYLSYVGIGTNISLYFIVKLFNK